MISIYGCSTRCTHGQQVRILPGAPLLPAKTLKISQGVPYFCLIAPYRNQDVVTHLVHQALALGLISQAISDTWIQCERFFAEHMQTAAESGSNDLCVVPRGGRDENTIEFALGKHLPIIRTPDIAQ